VLVLGAGVTILVAFVAAQNVVRRPLRSPRG
jgi:hypothetical protein